MDQIYDLLPALPLAEALQLLGRAGKTAWINYTFPPGRRVRRGEPRVLAVRPGPEDVTLVVAWVDAELGRTGADEVGETVDRR